MTYKRWFLLGQCTLAAGLTVLWLSWNPLSPDCPGGVECEGTLDPSVPAILDGEDEEPAPWPMAVEFAGCMTVFMQPSGDLECIYTPEPGTPSEPGSKLRLWVMHPRADDAVVNVDGSQSQSQPKRYGEQDIPGRGFELTIAADGARTLSVEIEDAGLWNLALRSSTDLTDLERSDLARFDSRGLLLEAHLMLDRSKQMLPHTKELIQQMLERGMLRAAVKEAAIASHHLVETGHVTQAGTLLDRLPSLTAFPWGHAAVSIYRGRVLEEQGYLREAAMAYRDGALFSLRLGDSGLQIDSLSTYAQVLSKLGYYRAAAYWAQRVVSIARQRGQIPDEIEVLLTAGFANLRLRDEGRNNDDPGPWFRRILELASHEPTIDANTLESTRLGLAALAVIDGEPAVGLRQLERIDWTLLNEAERFEAWDLRLRGLLAARDDQEHEEVQSALEGLEAAAREDSLEDRWLVAIRRGMVLEREKNLARAQRSYERAEALLDRLLALEYLGIYGIAGPVEHTEGTERLVALLLQTEQIPRAFEVSRRAQARRSRLALLFRRLDPDARQRLRPLREAYQDAKRRYYAKTDDGIDDRSTAEKTGRIEVLHAWKALEDEALRRLETSPAADTESAEPSSSEPLRPRAPGELLLGLYPHLGGLLVFIEDDQGMSRRVLSNFFDSDLSPNQLGPMLLDPIDDRLWNAERVRVLASGRAAGLPIHALRWRRGPLATQVPVVYGLEFPPAPPRQPRGTMPTALVVEDPRASATNTEANAVANALGRGGWNVQRKSSGTLDPQDLQQLLADVDHLHYAGHTKYAAGTLNDGQSLHRWQWPPYPGGAAVEPSYIKVDDDDRVEVPDVLMMDQVPRTAVLMGCSTGVTDERTEQGGLSLATAFIASGSAAVVASTKAIDGDEASELGRSLYDPIAWSSVADPGVWFMLGLQRARQRGLTDDQLIHYRVFVP